MAFGRDFFGGEFFQPPPRTGRRFAANPKTRPRRTGDGCGASRSTGRGAVPHQGHVVESRTRRSAEEKVEVWVRFGGSRGRGEAKRTVVVRERKQESNDRLRPALGLLVGGVTYNGLDDIDHREGGDTWWKEC